MANKGLASHVTRVLGRALDRTRWRKREKAPTPSHGGAGRSSYPGDFRGKLEMTYLPNPGNGNIADPGEIVWTWVPFEEDHSQGKDRPVLVIGRDGPWLLGLGLTSKDHDRDAAAEARNGRHWTDIGVGSWDRLGRPSEVRVDRIVRIDPALVRRQGAVLDEARFKQVAASVRGLA